METITFCFLPSHQTPVSVLPQVVFTVGDESNSIYFVERGEILLSKEDLQPVRGRAQTLSMMLKVDNT